MCHTFTRTTSAYACKYDVILSLTNMYCIVYFTCNARMPNIAVFNYDFKLTRTTLSTCFFSSAVNKRNPGLRFKKEKHQIAFKSYHFFPFNTALQLHFILYLSQEHKKDDGIYSRYQIELPSRERRVHGSASFNHCSIYQLFCLLVYF